MDGITGKFLLQNILKDEIIKDEEKLVKLKDDVVIDKLITTPILEDDHFFNNKLKDDISGNDYKEVVNQFPRNWILRMGMMAGKRKKYNSKKIMTLSDSLEGFNREYENRAPSKIRARSFIMPKRNAYDEIPGFLPHGPAMQIPPLVYGGMMKGKSGNIASIINPLFHGPIPLHEGLSATFPFLVQNQLMLFLVHSHGYRKLKLLFLLLGPEFGDFLEKIREY